MKWIYMPRYFVQIIKHKEISDHPIEYIFLIEIYFPSLHYKHDKTGDGYILDNLINPFVTKA